MTCEQPAPDEPITSVVRGDPGTIALGAVTIAGPDDPVMIVNQADWLDGVYDVQLPTLDGLPGDPGPRGPAGDLRPGMFLLGGM